MDESRGRKTAIYALTAAGARLAVQLQRELGGELFLPAGLAGEHGAAPFESLLPLVASRFHDFERQVFVAPCGVAVRAVAPVLKGKDRDPAVVCVDQRGRYAVSLLSGHLGGANDLAREVAKITAGRAVIGTATDLENVPAADVLARERGLAVADPAAIKAVNLELLAGETVQVLDPDNHLGLAGGDPEIARRFRLLADPDEWREAAAGIVVDHRAGPHPTGALLLHPPVLAAGVGCRKGASAGEIVSALREVLAEQRLAEASLVSMGSAAAKAVEPGLLEAAGILGCGLYFFEAGELARMSVPNPSDRVMREMGTPSVSEAAAMLLADSRELLVEKTVKGAVTCALAVVS